MISNIFATFLQRMSAKNYENRLTCVKVMSKDKVGLFIETSCTRRKVKLIHISAVVTLIVSTLSYRNRRPWGELLVTYFGVVSTEYR